MSEEENFETANVIKSNDLCAFREGRVPEMSLTSLPTSVASGRAVSWRWLEMAEKSRGWLRFGWKVDQEMRNGEIYNLGYGFGGVAGDLGG